MEWNRYKLYLLDIKKQVDRKPWHLRLLLEGEDRLAKNQNKREQKRTVSYSSVSEEWKTLENLREPTVETLIRQEMIEEQNISRTMVYANIS